MILAVIFLYDSFESQQINLSYVEWPRDFGIYLFIVVALTVVNWSLEAIRWKVSVEVFEVVSLKDSLLVVLSGLALNWVLPFTSGDAIVRWASLRDKYKTTSAMLLNRGIMLAITTVFGVYSIWFYSSSLLEFNLVIPLLIIGLFVLLFVARKSVGRFLSYFKQLRRVVLTKVIFLSVLRYFVFVVQFLMLLKVFLPTTSNAILLAGIGWVFFFRSAIPAFFGGLGLRETTGIIFFSDHIADLSLVVVPIFLLWLVNNAIPSVIGAIGLFRIQGLKWPTFVNKKRLVT